MNYDREEQAFYNRLDADPLSDSAIALWHALRVISKVVGRTEGLSVPQGVLCSKAGLRNPKSLERARNQLTSRGIIEWRARGKDKATVYGLLSLIRQNEAQNVTCQNEAHNGVHSGLQNGVQNGSESGAHSGAQNGPLYTPITEYGYVDIRRQNEAQNGVHSGVQNGVCSPAPFLDESEGYRLQAGMDAVEALARDIGMNHGDLGTINRLVADYSAAWCIEALNRARVNARGIPSWKYVERILRNWLEAGGMDSCDKPNPTTVITSEIITDSRRQEDERSARILRGEYD